ncbi:MAG TPA: hypothetical protein VK742_12690 [Candidatus Sulfotelmatobacter sp.]|nr:hypothetical protein [Candidatus Sulfotelmatobacter sp.]
MKFSRTLFLLFFLAQSFLRAQTPPQISPAVAAQMIMQPQPPASGPPVEISATAEFDPPVVGIGGKTFYRVTVNATQGSIRWPDTVSAPPELRFGNDVRGQLSLPDGIKVQPLTSFLYEVTPTATGHFTVPEFLVDSGWLPVTIPAASLDVVTTNTGLVPSKILMEISATNLFFGEPLRIRLVPPPDPANRMLFIRDMQFNGGALLADRLSTRFGTGPVDFGGQLKQVLTIETVVTPLTAGTITFSVQAFVGFNQADSAGCKFLVSDATNIFVRPLPTENELPGFTGAVGKFLADVPKFSTNQVHVGEPIKLKYNFHGEGNLTRYVPPEAPLSHEWQVIAGNVGENTFTLIPLTDEATSTPAIPFAAFDPATGNYYDLTIPAFPVTVTGDALPTQISDWSSGDTNSVTLQLGTLAKLPGRSAPDLQPPQMRAGLVLAQILPVFAFFILWRRDEHKRFLEANPEIVRRRRAKRDLRREINMWRQAVTQGDADKFVVHAAAAMRVAVAPHFPADARAMVCSDVLSQFEDAERNGKTGETVRIIFKAADARFADSKPPAADFMAMKSDVERVLQKLGEKL